MSKPSPITEKLKKSISEIGKKHYQIADELHVSRSQLSRWINHPETIDERFTGKLEKILGCSLSSLGITGSTVSSCETGVKQDEITVESSGLLPTSKKALAAYMQALEDGSPKTVRDHLLDAFVLNEKNREDG